jgi:chromosome segregation ATPase
MSHFGSTQELTEHVKELRKEYKKCEGRRNNTTNLLSRMDSLTPIVDDYWKEVAFFKDHMRSLKIDRNITTKPLRNRIRYCFLRKAVNARIHWIERVKTKGTELEMRHKKYSKRCDEIAEEVLKLTANNDFIPPGNFDRTMEVLERLEYLRSEYKIALKNGRDYNKTLKRLDNKQPTVEKVLTEIQTWKEMIGDILHRYEHIPDYQKENLEKLRYRIDWKRRWLFDYGEKKRLCNEWIEAFAVTANKNANEACLLIFSVLEDTE